MCVNPYLKKMPFDPVTGVEGKIQECLCGKCYECKRAKINEWAFRLEQQLKVAYSAYFVTLTYDEEHVPWGDGCRTLDQRDVSNFMKLLRYYEKGNKQIKYFACGEYGSTYGRPHYHLIVFNVNDPGNFAKSWTQGYFFAPPVKGGAVGYVMKYMCKEMTFDDFHGRRLPMFRTMSKHLGISYLTPEIVKYHKSNLNNTFCVNRAGFKIALPRYYKDKIWLPKSDERQAVTDYMQERAEMLNLRKKEEFIKNNRHLSRIKAIELMHYRRSMRRFEHYAEIF